MTSTDTAWIWDCVRAPAYFRKLVTLEGTALDRSVCSRGLSVDERVADFMARRERFAERLARVAHRAF